MTETPKFSCNNGVYTLAFPDGTRLDAKDRQWSPAGGASDFIRAIAPDGAIINEKRVRLDIQQDCDAFTRASASMSGMQPEQWHARLVLLARMLREQLNDTPPAFQAWDAPLPLPALLPDVPAMTPEMVPHGLRPWVCDIAARVQCPLEYVAVSALVAIAAVVGRRVGIYPKRHDDWLVIPNLWGMLIGRPGVLKSPAMVEALRPLDRLVVQALRDHARAVEDHTAAVAIAEAKGKAVKLELAKAAKRGDDQGLDHHGARLRALLDATPAPPVAWRYKTNDSTVEKLQDLLAENPHGLLLYRDELAGFLYALEKPGREGDREFYLECWNGNGSFTLDRIGRGTVHSPALCLSLLGSIQPGKLTEYVAATSDGGSGDDGLLQRLQLAVWPDTPPTWTNVDRWPDTEAKQRAWTVFQRLATLERSHVPEPESAGFEPETPPGIRFAPDGQEMFDQWRTALEGRLRAGDLHPALEAHLSKYRSLMPSLALLFHLTFHAHQDDLTDGCITPVSEAAAALAIRWCAFLERHALRVYAADMGRDTLRARTLARHICDGDIADGETVRSVYRKQWALLRTPDDVYGALSVLESLRWVRVEAEHTPGRPRDVIRIHPAIAERNFSPFTVLTTDITDRSPSESEQRPPCVSYVSCQLENDAEKFHSGGLGEAEGNSEKRLLLTTDITDRSVNGPAPAVPGAESGALTGGNRGSQGGNSLFSLNSHCPHTETEVREALLWCLGCGVDLF